MTEWRAIPGWPDYEVSEVGGVRRIKRAFGFIGKRRPYLDSNGYLTIVLRRRGERRAFHVHRLVAFAFIGEPPTPKHEAAHNDGDCLHNHFSNLRWASRSENQLDRSLHGTSNRGCRQHMARLDEAKVRKIRDMRASGVAQSVVAEAFGVARTTVQSIDRGRSWGWLS